jgi:RNA polymerase sigma-70 factor (ECF subfamily)
LVILRTLAPRERAAFLLREAFEVTYAEIARLTGQAEPAVRQVVSRARRKLRTPCANPVDVKEHRELVRAFRHATSTGDRRPLDRILCLWASGGAAPEFALAS